MSDLNGRYDGAVAGASAAGVDAGLRAFMLGVYNKLAIGLFVAGGLAWITGNVPEVTRLFFQVTEQGVGFTPLGLAVRFAPLAILLVSMFAMRNPTARGASLLYWSTVALFGVGLGVLFLAYASMSIATTFFVTASAFGGLSLVGYVTKRDLSAFGSFLIMGLFGLIIASLVNFFMQSAMMSFIISVVGVLIFSGLIAYDTQKLKLGYYAMKDDANGLGVLTSYGALNLFLDFLNLFLFLLRLFGGRR